MDNTTLLKDIIAKHIISQSELQDLVEIDDFSSYLASESWSTIPEAFREATYESRESVPSDIDDVSLDNTSVAFVDTLISYGFASDNDDALRFLRNVLVDYLAHACAPPPIWSTTRTTECEICEREVPLTYHHLIPRSTHAKVLKKKWHPDSMINSVAWLFHHVASNEELARQYYTVELLLQREDILKWRNYASKQRFGVRRG
ncbi:hypothetical protein H0H93_014319 [Arthromyces matolae]|nr:hypothetical protein H0H93_014319 [Arthromyces matolae]